MFTQAATCFSSSWSASFSAAARSGRLVKTSRTLISQSLVDRGVAQANAERALQPRVVEAPRLLHERKQGCRQPLAREFFRDARWTRQAVGVGDEVEPVTHFDLRVVGCVVDAGGGLLVQGAADDRGQVIGVDMVRVDIVFVS